MSASGKGPFGTAGVGAGAQVVELGIGLQAADALANNNFFGFHTTSGPLVGSAVASELFNGATWDRQRTPSWIDNVAASATGSTALHTPAAGKKVRLMRYMVHVTGNAAAAAAAILSVKLLDAAVSFNVNHRFFIPNAAATTLGGITTGWIDVGNGYLSVLANNVLNVDLSFALTAGVVNVIACGTEE